MKGTRMKSLLTKSLLGFTIIVTLAACTIDKPTLTLPPVDELNMRKVEWIVINEGNVDTVITKLKSEGKAFALYALTGDGYGNLGLNFSDIRALVQQQQAIIAAYEGYYQEAEEAMDNAVAAD
jgi:hypothetical protein